MRVLNHSRPDPSSAAAAPPLLVVTPAAAAAGMVGEAQLQQPAGGAAAGAGSDAAGLNADMVIILAALFCVLVCALGLNSLLHHCFVLDCGRRRRATVAAPAPAPAPPHAAADAGMTKNRELMRRIPVVAYEARPGASASAAAAECAICLGEFDGGDEVRVLPGCRHGFHVHCIDLWLPTHPSCPTCRNSLLIQQDRHHAGDGDGEATTVAAGEEA